MKDYIWSVEQSAARFGDRPAIISPWGMCTFSELAGMVATSCEDLRTSAGRARVVSGPPAPRQFALLLAARRSSTVVLPLYPGGSEERQEIARLWEQNCAGRMGTDSRGGIAFLSSGTTGRAAVHVDRTGVGRGGRVPVFQRYAAGAEFGPHIMSRGSYHAGIVRPALYALEAGSTVVVNERYEPLELERQVIEVGASSLFLSPEQLYDFARYSTEEMPTLERIMFGGDYMPLWMRQVVAEKFGERLIGFYGTSVGAISEYGLSEIRRSMSVGRPYPHLQCRVVTREGRDGEVQVRRRGQADPSIGWEPTGDVGYIDQSGNIALIGRDRWVAGTYVTDVWHQLIETEGVFAVAITARDGRNFYDVEFDDATGAEHRVRRVVNNSSHGRHTLRFHARGTLGRTESLKVYLEQ